MLTKLLSRSTCASCRQCCTFSSYDIWSTPVLNGETLPRVRELLPEQQFLRKGENAWLFRVQSLSKEDTFTCPLLDPAYGCRLGEDKPFTCRIWPVQIMEVEGRQAITLSPICDAMLNLPLRTLLRFVRDELEDVIFAYADAHPDEVLPYDGVSPVLVWRVQKQSDTEE